MSDADKTYGFGEANRLQLLIDSVVDYAIYMLDLEGRVVSWNSGACASERLYGRRNHW